MKILFATSEALPLIKTGGLADVSGSLPPALQQHGHDVRLVLPAYRAALAACTDLQAVASLELTGSTAPVRVLEGRLPGTQVGLYLIDSPRHFDRPGGPYSSTDGRDWPDNPERFALFARAVCALALDQANTAWRPDLVHCNDWQSGLVPALLSLQPQRPATVFTIHNLAYQGLFSWETFQRLELPYDLWSLHALEYHGQMSFIKGGLAFADRLTTVSPTYAQEICTPEFGYGLEGLLNYRAAVLTGILNGVDYSVWDPATDALIARHYSATDLAGKADNKAALQRHFGLPEDRNVPLIGMVGRLVEQKGIDLVVAVLARLMRNAVQLVVLGSGQPQYEQALRGAADHYAGLGVVIGYDEAAAHLIEAGADLFLMPSRFEPCGLNQLYSLRYGTLPVVRRTGGLADTVVDAGSRGRGAAQATGFVFDQASPEALHACLRRALAHYGSADAWTRMVKRAMRQDFSWQRSAEQYLALYRDAIEQNA